jgi:uncharacterized ParB-like nuclease family protein
MLSNGEIPSLFVFYFRVMNKPVCFNCGGGHVIRDCKEKKDYAKINAKRAEFMGKSQNSQTNSKR